ncbi:hypothetical protein ACN28E_24970 [Archangium lansingense]|uniref:hypothetical protein n=1 Tax=Archangium lansingense TaxID=2995310 RepID=UPI003B7714D5
MPSELDLTTLAKAADVLKVPANSAGLADLITTASELLAEWVGYPLHLRTGVVETCAGGAPHLFLRSGGVRSVASITVFGVARAPSTWVVEDAVKGILRAQGEPWPFTGRTGGGVSQAPMYREDTGDIIVTFDAGWVTPGQVELAKAADPASTLTSDLPAAFQQAALVAVTALFQGSGQNPNVQALSLGSGSITFRDSAEASLPTLARSLVRRYRKHSRGTP